jgi:signal transduction histidine kinase
METWLESFARANFRRSADTAHDLKTPLNVAVLNLELLRMRVRKLAGEDDAKLNGYTAAIEIELRRMGRIFDSFFLLSTPPKNEGDPAPVDLAALTAEAAASHELTVEDGEAAHVLAHESRIRQALKLFFEGATHLLTGELHVTGGVEDHTCCVTITGQCDPDLELSKLFKFYYSDPAGSPDLSLATARLIAETYGGELNAARESDKVSLRLSFPLGAR